MDFRREIRYAAEPEAVFAMLIDDDFLRRRATAAHARASEASVTRDGDTVSTTLKQSLPAELPDALRRLVGETVDLTEVVNWAPAEPDRSRTGRISLEVAGVPVAMTGTITIGLDGSGTSQVVEGAVKASIPLIGRKVEEAAIPALAAGIDGMEELGRTWLTR